ncbi:MAG: hypothetical protein K5839_02780 [Treponemataceae bacterium]|nr:hypothetical protein [Treponemataceae bacterium]
MQSIYIVNLGIVLIFTIIQIILIQNDTILERKYHFQLSVSALIILSISLMEYFTLIFDGAPVKFRYFHIIANYIGFSLTPILCIVFCTMLLPKRTLFPFIIVNIVYIVLFFVSLFFPKYSIFYVDENNNYSRSGLFFVHIIMYLMGIILVFIGNVRLYVKYQYSRNFFLMLSFVFLIFSSSLQIVWPQIYSTWVCLSIVNLCYFIYLQDLFKEIDEKSELLNIKSFEKDYSATDKRRNITLIRIDAKKDTSPYTKEELSVYVPAIADVIKREFRREGKCYLIDETEYAVIFKEKILDYENLERKFYKRLLREQKIISDLPLVTMAHTEFCKNDDFERLQFSCSEQFRIFARERVRYIYQ